MSHVPRSEAHTNSFAPPPVLGQASPVVGAAVVAVETHCNANRYPNTLHKYVGSAAAAAPAVGANANIAAQDVNNHSYTNSSVLIDRKEEHVPAPSTLQHCRCGRSFANVEVLQFHLGLFRGQPNHQAVGSPPIPAVMTGEGPTSLAPANGLKEKQDSYNYGRIFATRTVLHDHYNYPDTTHGLKSANAASSSSAPLSAASAPPVPKVKLIKCICGKSFSTLKDLRGHSSSKNSLPAKKNDGVHHRLATADDNQQADKENGMAGDKPRTTAATTLHVATPPKVAEMYTCRCGKGFPALKDLRAHCSSKNNLLAKNDGFHHHHPATADGNQQADKKNGMAGDKARTGSATVATPTEDAQMYTCRCGKSFMASQEFLGHLVHTFHFGESPAHYLADIRGPSRNPAARRALPESRGTEALASATRSSGQGPSTGPVSAGFKLPTTFGEYSGARTQQKSVPRTIPLVQPAVPGKKRPREADDHCGGSSVVLQDAKRTKQQSTLQNGSSKQDTLDQNKWVHRFHYCSIIPAATSVSAMDYELLCSYNWANHCEPTIFVPGKTPMDTGRSGPPVFTKIPLPNTLGSGVGAVLVDDNTARAPSGSFGPAFLALDMMRPQQKLDEVDVLADSTSLHDLFKFCMGIAHDRTWRLKIFTVSNTLVIERATMRAKEEQVLCKSFRDAFSVWPCETRDSSGHQRLLEYPIGPLNCAVRCSVDAYYSDLGETQSSSPPLPLDASRLDRLPEMNGLHAIPKGVDVSHGATANLMIQHRSSFLQDGPRRSFQFWDLLWFPCTQVFISGSYHGGLVDRVDIYRSDDFVREWETREDVQRALRRLVTLLQELRRISSDRERCCVLTPKEQALAPSRLEMQELEEEGQGLPGCIVERFWGGDQ